MSDDKFKLPDAPTINNITAPTPQLPDAEIFVESFDLKESKKNTTED